MTQNLANNERERKADLFRELALDAYHRISESNAVIDSKTHNMLAITVGLIPLILGAFYYLISAGHQVALPFSFLVFVSLASGAVLFLVAVVIGVWNCKPRDFSLLHASGFVQDHKDEALVDVKEITAATLGNIVESNRNLVNRKAKGFEAMLWFVASGTAAFSIGFMLLLTTILN
jgi:hypothetical protein